MIMITTNQSIELTNKPHGQSEISLYRNVILSYFYDLLQNTKIFNKCIVDTVHLGLTGWIMKIPADIKLKTSNIDANISWSVKY